jgi:homoserine/homoserine lactone efflux protein
MLPLDFILYLQIIIFLFITPGTPRVVIISYSMNYGVGKCIWSALGDVTANFIQAVLVVFLIGKFFSENSIILNIFKWIGVFYILYLAYDIFKSRPKNLTEKNNVKKSNLSFFKDGFLIAGTSPKAWMFFSFYISTIYRFQRKSFSSVYNSYFIIHRTRFFIFNWLCSSCTKAN